MPDLGDASSEGYLYNGEIPDGYWVDAASLKPGYRLLNSDDTWSQIVEVRVAKERLNAFNLRVDEYSTYFVRGANSGFGPAVWVHNNCNIADGPLNWSGTDPNGLTRKDHVRRHGVDDPSRNVPHGVFSENPINQTADAWQRAKDLKIEPTVQGDRLVYEIPSPNAGIQGGNPSLPGHGQTLDTIVIVVEAGNNKIITSFPQ